MITIRNNNKNYTWIDARDITRDDVTILKDEYGISSELLADILDQDEESRIEKEDDYIALIIRLPQDDDHKSPLKQNAIPIGIILFPELVITICQGDSIVLEDFSKLRFRQYPVSTKEGFVISLLGRAALVFTRILKYINKQKDLAEDKLRETVLNSELSNLLDIQKSLVYLTTSLTSNQLLLEKILKVPFFLLNNQDEHDFLEDVLTDNRQAIVMAQIYSDILSRTMDAFSSIISNNMNESMKKLTVVSLCLMFPTLITGFFGMNIKLPFQANGSAWIILFIICLLVSLISAYIFSRRKTKSKQILKKITKKLEK